MLLYGMMENYGELLWTHRVLRMIKTGENLLTLYPLLIIGLYAMVEQQGYVVFEEFYT